MKFEEALKKLENIVLVLEEGNIPLDKAIKKYQDGLELSKKCLEILNSSEKKINICLKDKKGKRTLKSFNTEDQKL